jgi:hypothetical protein
MDIDAYFLLQTVNEMEDDDDEMDLERLATAAGIILLGAEEACILHAERRKNSRLYLCRPQLLPNPRLDTPWQALHASCNDRAFTMGFDVRTFEAIIDAGFGTAWYSTPVKMLLQQEIHVPVHGP